MAVFKRKTSFKNLAEFQQWQYENDPDYRRLVDNIRAAAHPRQEEDHDNQEGQV